MFEYSDIEAPFVILGLYCSLHILLTDVGVHRSLCNGSGHSVCGERS